MLVGELKSIKKADPRPNAMGSKSNENKNFVKAAKIFLIVLTFAMSLIYLDAFQLSAPELILFLPSALALYMQESAFFMNSVLSDI